MKVRSSVKPICEKCKVIKRKETKAYHFGFSVVKIELAFCNYSAFYNMRTVTLWME